MEGVTLLGYLEHAALVALWARHLYSSLRRIVINALHSCTALVHKRAGVQKMIAEVQEAHTTELHDLIKKFHTKKIAKAVYDCKYKFFIIKELRTELCILRYILDNPDITNGQHLYHTLSIEILTFKLLETLASMLKGDTVMA